MDSPWSTGVPASRAPSSTGGSATGRPVTSVRRQSCLRADPPAARDDGRLHVACMATAIDQVHAADEDRRHDAGDSDETPRRELVDRARAALAPDLVARATEMGRRLTVKEALDLARPAQAMPA